MLLTQAQNDLPGYCHLTSLYCHITSLYCHITSLYCQYQRPMARVNNTDIDTNKKNHTENLNSTLLKILMSFPKSPAGNPDWILPHREYSFSDQEREILGNPEISEVPCTVYSLPGRVHSVTSQQGVSKRDVVYLGWPIAPSYMSPNAWGKGELRCLGQCVQLYTGAQINFGDLTPYLIYASQDSRLVKEITHWHFKQCLTNSKALRNFYYHECSGVSADWSTSNKKCLFVCRYNIHICECRYTSLPPHILAYFLPKTDACNQ